jgi:lipoic acid synthetase
MTIGQYLQPTKMHIEVAEFIHPDVFAMYKEEGLKRGLSYVESGPLVRSSYHAERHL